MVLKEDINMTSVLIAGATGLVGHYALLKALADPRIERVIAPTRRALDPHPKLTNPVIDMSDLPKDADWWAVDNVICALGTTRKKAGSAEAFRAIDYDLQYAIALHAHQHGARHLALTSSIGANKNSPFFYLRTKGELENTISHLQWQSLTILRPGAIIGSREDSRLDEKIISTTLKLLSPIIPKKYQGNHAEDIASTLLNSVLSASSGLHILEADRISK